MWRNRLNSSQDTSWNIYKSRYPTCTSCATELVVESAKGIHRRPRQLNRICKRNRCRAAPQQRARIDSWALSLSHSIEGGTATHVKPSNRLSLTHWLQQQGACDSALEWNHRKRGHTKSSERIHAVVTQEPTTVPTCFGPNNAWRGAKYPNRSRRLWPWRKRHPIALLCVRPTTTCGVDFDERAWLCRRSKRGLGVSIRPLESRAPCVHVKTQTH